MSDLGYARDEDGRITYDPIDSCGDHPERKAIAYRGYCAECHREFVNTQVEVRLTREEAEALLDAVEDYGYPSMSPTEVMRAADKKLRAALGVEQGGGTDG